MANYPLVQKEIGKQKKPRTDPLLPGQYDPRSDSILMALRKRREKFMSDRMIPVTNPNPLKVL